LTNLAFCANSAAEETKKAKEQAEACRNSFNKVKTDTTQAFKLLSNIIQTTTNHIRRQITDDDVMTNDDDIIKEDDFQKIMIKVKENKQWLCNEEILKKILSFDKTLKQSWSTKEIPKILEENEILSLNDEEMLVAETYLLKFRNLDFENLKSISTNCETCEAATITFDESFQLFYGSNCHNQKSSPSLCTSLPADEGNIWKTSNQRHKKVIYVTSPLISMEDFTVVKNSSSQKFILKFKNSRSPHLKNQTSEIIHPSFVMTQKFSDLMQTSSEIIPVSSNISSSSSEMIPSNITSNSVEIIPISSVLNRDSSEEISISSDDNSAS